LKKYISHIIFLFIIFNVNAAFSQITINEICTINDDAIEDENGDKSDWVELYNNSNTAINISNYKLKSVKQNLIFSFADTTILPNGFIVVFISGKNRNGHFLHTNFKVVNNDTIILLDSNGNNISEIAPPDLKVDDSFGANIDGNNVYEVLTTPTPNGTNSISNHYASYTALPQFSLDAGFYNGTQTITISNADANAVTYFTINGKEPSNNSTQYLQPIIITKTTVVKAYCKNPSKPSSKIICNTYFIDETAALPVISISTDSNSLYNDTTGLLMLGLNTDSIPPYYNANFWLETQLKVNMELFDKNKVLQLNQNCELQIHGGTMNRTQDMKSFRLLAKKQFEKDKFYYPLLKDKPINAYRKFVLRNGSSDFLRAQLRDGLIHKILIKNTFNDAVGYEPCQVFLNGKFYGIQDIREKLDDYYLEENHNADRKNLDFLVEENVVELGDWLAFDSVYNFVLNNDMQNDNNFKVVENRIDLQNIADYFIAETYFDNNDWPNNNLRLWRERKPGSKFRYIIFDLDVSLGGEPWSPYTMDMLNRALNYFTTDVPIKHCIILKKLLTNVTFKNYFVNRYADLINTAFSPKEVTQMLDTVKANISADLPKHFARWGRNFSDWDYEIKTLVEPYIINRNILAKENITNQFLLPNQHNITINCLPLNAFDTLHINTIKYNKNEFVGTYFETVPIGFKIKAKDGYTFSHWQLSNGTKIFTDSVNINLEKAIDFTAIYYKKNEAVLWQIFPNPVVENKLFLHVDDDIKDNISIAITNSLGVIIYNATAQNFVGANLIEIDVSSLANGLYTMQILHKNNRETAKFILMR